MGGPHTVGTLFTEDKRELDSRDKDTKASSTKEMSILEEEESPRDAADTAAVSPDRSHENFELILDPAALKNGANNTPKRKTLNWMRNKTSLVQEERRDINDVGLYHHQGSRNQLPRCHLL